MMSWQQLRKYQDEQENAGWRIQMIPYDDTSRPVVVFNGFALLGAIGFCAGVFLILSDPKQTNLGLKVAVGSLAFGLFGIWFKTRRQEQGWQVVPGRCVDRELRKVLVPSSHGSSDGWYWRIVCEYEYHGQKYRVTPNVQWMNCTSEAAALKFIQKRIGSDDSCRLRINPNNPLQTKLSGGKG